MGPLGPVSHRPLRHEGQLQDRHLRVPVSGRVGVGDGCHVNLVARNVGICLSSDSPPTKGPSEDKERSGQRYSWWPPDQWPKREWSLDLLELSVEPPRSLPQFPKLLKQPRSNVFHQNPQVLSLHVWKLSQIALLQTTSLKESQNVLPEANFGSLL